MALVVLAVSACRHQVKELNLSRHSADDRYASYSPDGEQILFESNRTGRWQLYLMQPDGTHTRQLTFGSRESRRPSWHPNGRRIVFECIEADEHKLCEYDTATAAVNSIAIGHYDLEPMFARYSPDGRMLAFANRMEEGQSKLVLLDLSNNQSRTLLDTGYRSFYPNWHPNGDALVFFSRHDTDNQTDELYTIHPDGGSISRLTRWPKHNFCPVFSPDGSAIAYVTSMEGTRPEIYLMNADGENTLRVTYNDDGDTLPSWSPDGERLLITGYRDGNFEILELLRLPRLSE